MASRGQSSSLPSAFVMLLARVLQTPRAVTSIWSSNQWNGILFEAFRLQSQQDLGYSTSTTEERATATPSVSIKRREGAEWRMGIKSPIGRFLAEIHSEAIRVPSRYFSGVSTAPLKSSFVLRILPRSLIPYAELMRIDKFSATWLLGWPCFWSIALAAPHGSWPDVYMLTLFGLGAAVMRAAGCTVNDLWDVKLDRLVFRTKNRPLAASQLTRKQAIAFLGAELTAGLIILLQLNNYSKILGALSVPFVVTYPLTKRWTYWPQLYLGMTINWGALLGWSAIRGSCDWSVVLPLYASGIFWTLIYDTIYACQDRVDDRVIGVKSTALYFDTRVKTWLSGFAVCQLLCLSASGYAADCGGFYFTSVLATGCHLAWQIARVDLDRSDDCMRTFASNKWLGAILFTGITLDRWMT